MKIEKACNDCGSVKPSGEFYTNASPKSDGLSVYCRECSKRQRREWRAAPENRARCLAYSKAKREAVIEHYGGACVCCGESAYQFLAVDHIDGGGNKHRKHGGRVIASWLLRNGLPGGFRVLCHNCNLAWGLYGYCPHVREALP